MIRMKIETEGPAPGDRRGPPLFQPRPNEVKQPARIEMIENEMAKLEKPDQDRCRLLHVAELGEMLLVVVKCSWPSGTAVLLLGRDSAGS
jgi:hypothetical protein